MSMAAHKVAAEAPTSHDGFYSSCVTVIIAVMVVLYFDERVRGRLTPRERGTAIGWLGGVITLGLLTPLLAMAGVISDTTRAREVAVAFTFLFLVAVFSGATSIWGREDGARIRTAQAAPQAPCPPLPSVPVPRPGMTEREHADDVLGAAMAIVAQAHTRRRHIAPRAIEPEGRAPAPPCARRPVDGDAAPAHRAQRRLSVRGRAQRNRPVHRGCLPGHGAPSCAT
jgi:hypothetical protein